MKKIAFINDSNLIPLYNKYTEQKMLISLPSRKQLGNVIPTINGFKQFLKNEKISAVLGGTGKWLLFKTINMEHNCMKACKEIGIPYFYILHSIINERNESYGHPSVTFSKRDSIIQGHNSFAIGNYRLDDVSFKKFIRKPIKNRVLLISQNMYSRYGMKYHYLMYKSIIQNLKGYYIVIKKHPYDKFDYSDFRVSQIVEHKPSVLYKEIAKSCVTIASSSNANIESLVIGTPSLNIKFSNHPNIFFGRTKAIITCTPNNIKKAIKKSQTISKELMKKDVEEFFYKVDGNCHKRLFKEIASRLK